MKCVPTTIVEEDDAGDSLGTTTPALHPSPCALGHHRCPRVLSIRDGPCSVRLRDQLRPPKGPAGRCIGDARAARRFPPHRSSRRYVRCSAPRIPIGNASTIFLMRSGVARACGSGKSSRASRKRATRRRGALPKNSRPPAAPPKELAAQKSFHFLGAGVHRESLNPKSGETWYLAPGAVIFGSLNLFGVENVTVLGRGSRVIGGASTHRAREPVARP